MSSSHSTFDDHLQHDALWGDLVPNYQQTTDNNQHQHDDLDTLNNLLRENQKTPDNNMPSYHSVFDHVSPEDHEFLNNTSGNMQHDTFNNQSQPDAYGLEMSSSDEENEA